MATIATEELQIHLNDVGTIFEVTLQDANGIFPISGATVLQISFLKADLVTVLVKAAVLTTDGSDGKLNYTALAGDLDQLGDWQLQAYVVTPLFSGYSSIDYFEVVPNI